MKATPIWFGLMVWASLFPGCDSGSGTSGVTPASGCDVLAACCAGIKDPATKQNCLGSVSTYRALPNGDPACTSALPSFQSQCSGAGGSTGACDQLAECCTRIQDATAKQQCSTSAATYKGMASGDVTCGAVLPSYQSMCGGGTGGSGGENGGGCDQLGACCQGIQDAATRQQCSTAVTTYKDVANGDVTCSALLPTYQAMCKTGAGGSGGASSSNCDKLVVCCNGMEASSKQACLDYVSANRNTPNGDAVCASALQGYESAKLCIGGTGGSGGLSGQGGTGGSGGTAGSGGKGGSGGGGQCLPGGASCQSYTECCSQVCDNQICRACAGSGQACTDTGECCSGMICYDDQCRSCRADNSGCTYASDCCSNICNGAVCEACKAVGESCLGGKKCCSGLTCSDWGECIKPGPSCENAEDCGSVSTMICDPNGYGCQPDQCGSTECPDGRVCVSQADEVSIAACYRSCSPLETTTGCPSGMSCLAFFLGDESEGFCVNSGNGQPNASCESSVVSTRCIAGYDCFDSICMKLCKFFGSASCPTGQYCSVYHVCYPDGDTVTVGESCTQQNGRPCGPSGGKWQGLCIGGKCEKVCRDTSECGSSDSCMQTLYSEELGTCRPK